MDADQQGYRYIKRFVMEASAKKVGFIGENPESRLLLISDNVYPRFKVVFGGADKSKPAMEIDVEEFIGVKGIKAKGKRISTFEVGEVIELEPTRWPEPEAEESEPEEETQDDAPDASDGDDNDSDVLDELTGQMKLF